MFLNSYCILAIVYNNICNDTCVLTHWKSQKKYKVLPTYVAHR